ncbi:MAG TPA: DUF3142 domain-containing protein [Chthonomonadaceae bacterium]|nr:DUF3142 domain-containing protein [Chthonomonadaceae bacterium]
MSRRRKAAICLVLGLMIAAGGLRLRQRLRAPLPPLQVSLWYWHTPFQIAPSEAAQWQALGVKTLFVRAGTFFKEGEGARLILPQQWAGPSNGLDIHLVFNLDYGLVRDFAHLSPETLADALSAGIRQERARAEQAGVKVVGIQIDFDCPTRLLPRYAMLLRQLRHSIAPPTRLSITALPTWFIAGDVEPVMEAVDFTVPQYYEAGISKTLDDFQTVSRLAMVESGLKLAGRHGLPFYAGLPAYGHALLYDKAGRLLGPYRTLHALGALHHPSFRLARAFPADRNGKPATAATYIGEDIYDFEAIKPALDGRGLGYHLVYDLPTPVLVAQHLALVREQRPRSCLGVILYRYPEPDETATLPLPTLAALLRGETPQPQLKVQLKAATAPWELIETGRTAARAPLDLTVSVTNSGSAGSFLAPDAVSVTLLFDRPGLEDIALRDFDTCETFYRDAPDSASSASATAMRASAARANGVTFRLDYLAPGATARIGPIRIPADGATKAQGYGSIVGAGRFTIVQGVIPPTDLTALARHGK